MIIQGLLVSFVGQLDLLVLLLVQEPSEMKSLNSGVSREQA